MRVLNRIVNILVLVLAIAAAGFSYLLFNKREKLVSGWEQMAQSITQSAKALDEKSGTKLSVELNQESLNHKNFNNKDLSSLTKTLPKLPDGAKKIIAQRDALAETLNKVAKNCEVTNVSTDDLKKLSTSEAKQKQIADEVAKIVRRNEQIMNDYVRLSGAAGAWTNIGNLKKDPNDAAKKFMDAINSMKTRINIYNQNFTQIARTVGVSNLQLNGNQYAAELKKLQDGVNNMKNDLNKTRNELNQERNKNRNLTGTLKARDNAIHGHLDSIKKLQAENKRLSLIINPDGGPVDPNETELYARIQGKIETVNERWGFVVINLGSKIPVIKKFKKTEKLLYVDLLRGFTLTIARNLPTDKPEYIGKITITEVGENYAVANIDKESLQSAVKVGDAVYFTTEDSAANIRLKESLLKGKK